MKMKGFKMLDAFTKKEKSSSASSLPKAGRERCVRGGEGSSSRGIALQLVERFNVVIFIIQVALPKITVSSVSDPGPR